MAKLLVSLVLCVVIFLKAEWNELAQVIQNSNLVILFCAFTGIAGSVFISAYKWQVLLKIHSISLNPWRLTRYYFSAVFFNNFLPSNIGGDGYRIYRTMSFGKSGAIVAVLTERLTGLWALVVLGCCGTTWLVLLDEGVKPGWLNHVLWLLLAGSILPIVLGRFLIANALIRERIGKISEKASILLERITDYQMRPLSSAYVVGLSFFFQIYTLGWMLLLASAVHEPVAAYKMIIGMVLSSVVALIPISLNGIGLWDGSFIFTMNTLGMPYNKALMVMLLIRCSLVPLSLTGCLFYLSEKSRVSGEMTSSIYKQPKK